MITGLTLFVLAIIVISTLRTRFLFELQGASLLIFGKSQPGMWLYALLMLPGTILHELSHWLMAEVLQVPTGEIRILPVAEDQGREKKLGSVATARTDPFRGFLIGIAPFIVGIITLSLLGYLLEVGWGVYLWWQLALVIYGLIVVGSSMLISRADRRYWPVMIGLFFFVALVLYASGFSLSPSSLQLLVSILNRINLVLGLTIGLNLVMILVFYLIRRSLEQMTRKRVVR